MKSAPDVEAVTAVNIASAARGTPALSQVESGAESAAAPLAALRDVAARDRERDSRAFLVFDAERAERELGVDDPLLVVVARIAERAVAIELHDRPALPALVAQDIRDH